MSQEQVTSDWISDSDKLSREGMNEMEAIKLTEVRSQVNKDRERWRQTLETNSGKLWQRKCGEQGASEAQQWGYDDDG